jgi:hypothetical protein
MSAHVFSGEYNHGVLKGVDQFGNKYYENKDRIFRMFP